MKQTIKIVVVLMVMTLLCGCGAKSAGSKLEDCAFCKGSGVCNVCKGAGENSYGGNPARTCTICRGAGTCTSCDGKGKVTREQQEKNQSEAQKTFDALNGYLNQGSSGGNSGSPCSACGGTGRGKIKCTNCGGSGISPVYESTKGSALHAFADKDCAKCSGTGYERCTSCWGSGKK